MAAATYERDGHVATITYNRPEALNAVNGAMRRVASNTADAAEGIAAWQEGRPLNWQAR